MVSLVSLASGVPKIPYETTSEIALHRPSGFMPVHARASRSSCSSCDDVKEQTSWPQERAEKADPENNFRE